MKANWELRRLDEIALLRPPKKLAKEQLTESSTVSFVPMDRLQIGVRDLAHHESKPLGEVYKGYTYFADGDVLLAKITPCFENGKQGVARGLENGVGFGSSEFFVIRPGEILSADFLYYFLEQQSVRDSGARVMSGAVGHKRVPKEHIEQLQIPLPPLEEQQRIVAILDEAFEGLDRAKANAAANLESAKQLFPAILTEAFQQDRTGWSRKTLAELCEKITDGTHQTPKYYDQGYIFLSSKNVTSGRIDWDNIRYIDEHQHLTMQKRLSPRLGDVLLAKNGTTGVAAIVDREVPFDIYVSLALLRAKEEILPEFLLHFTNSSIAKKQFNKRLKGIGVPNLHLKEIREVEMTYPRDLSEQKRLVRYFDNQRRHSEALIKSAENKSRDLDQLRQSLLNQAFAGELT